MLQSNYVINHHKKQSQPMFVINHQEKQSQQIPEISKTEDSYTEHIFLQLCAYTDTQIYLTQHMRIRKFFTSIYTVHPDLQKRWVKDFP